MNITYTEEKKFTQEQVEKIFLAVGWKSGHHPERLYKSLMNSSTVFSAWDGDELVGMARVLDDGELLAFIHNVLVLPEYQGKGIGDAMMRLIMEKYKDYFYIEVVPEKSKNVPFYERYGFKVLPDGAALQINYLSPIP